MNVNKQLFDPIVSFFKVFSGEEQPKLVVPDVNNVFGFYSPTGGTGVTTLVVNIAAILATHGKVAVLDLDLFHPALFRFLMTEEDEKTSLQYDVYDKFIASSTPANQFGHKTRVDNLTLFTTMPNADMIRYCEMDYHGIADCIKELSRLYDYVLLDIKGNLIQESVVAAMETATKIYTLIRPCISDLENVYKDTALLNIYSFGARTKNIIQSPVGDSFLDPKDIEEYNLSSFCAIPYVKKVEQMGYNYDIFVLADGGSDKSAKKYIECCTWIADRIANYGLEEVGSNVGE